MGIKRRFEFKDSKSDKFWEYETDTDGATVTWGRTGSTGQSQVVDIATAEKRAREKVAKGYVEVALASKPKLSPEELKNALLEDLAKLPTEDIWDELIRNIKAK